MNYYFIYGPQMQDVVTTYTDLTGKPELPSTMGTTSMQVELLSRKYSRLLAKFRVPKFHVTPCI
jgi:alpha-glucosidase (family GH31 glycosyl hydrolase)